jgi:hypothetical protein
MSMNESAIDLDTRIRVCRTPVFLIGAERSGTTILAVALGRHSRLWYSGESHVFSTFFDRDRVQKAYEHGTHRWRLLREQSITRQEFVESLGLGVNALLTSRSAGLRWIEKTPRNTLMADVLAEMFPHASFVHLVRDGRHVVHSMIHFLDDPDAQTREDREQGRAGPLWARDFVVACRTWRAYVEAGLQFCELHPDRCFTVYYHELVADPGGSFGQIYDFLQVDFEGEPAELFGSTRLNSSFSRAAPPADPWSEWTADQRRIFLTEAGAAMVSSGLVGDDELRHLMRTAGSAIEPPDVCSGVDTAHDGRTV